MIKLLWRVLRVFVVVTFHVQRGVQVVHGGGVERGFATTHAAVVMGTVLFSTLCGQHVGTVQFLQIATSAFLLFGRKQHGRSS